MSVGSDQEDSHVVLGQIVRIAILNFAQQRLGQQSAAPRPRADA